MTTPTAEDTRLREALARWRPEGADGEEQRRVMEAVAMLRHLLAHCPEGEQPAGVTIGRAVAEAQELWWAAGLLGYPVWVCENAACAEGHVTLETEPVRA